MHYVASNGIGMKSGGAGVGAGWDRVGWDVVGLESGWNRLGKQITWDGTQIQDLAVQDQNY